MPINFDEKQLLSKKISPDSDQPVQEQILRIALYDEYHAFEFYSQVVSKFGSVQPFVNIIEAEKKHYSSLLLLLEKYQLEAPENDWPQRIVIPDSLQECCEIGVAAEIDNIAMYDHLLSYVQQNDIQDILFRLQAASYNNHLPAFRAAVISYSNQDNNNLIANQSDKPAANPEEMAGKFEEYKTLLQSVMSGKIDQEELGKLLSNSNISLIGGLLTGSFGVMLLNNINKNPEDTTQPSDSPL